MDLLHVLGRLVLLEPRQAELPEQNLAGPLLSVADLGLSPENASDSAEDGGDGPA